MLSAEDLQLLRCSASILLEVTVSSSEEISAVAEEGAILKLVSLFSSEFDEAKEFALLLLGNISADSLPLRDAVVEAGGFTLFLEVLENPDGYTDTVVDAAAQALVFCTRHNPDGPFDEDLTHQMISALATFIESTENTPSQSLEDALMTLAQIIQDRPTTIAAVDTGITSQLVQLTSSSSRRVQYHALECLTAVTFHGLDGTEALVDADGLESLGLALTSPHFEHRSVACRAVGCIVSSIPAHVESLIPSSVVPALARVISDEEEYAELRYQATLALSTLSGKASGDEELNFIIKAGSIEAFCSVLQPSEYNASLLALQAIIALVSQDWEGQKEALEQLNAAGGVSRLRNIRDGVAFRDQAIGNMAQMILKAHFPESSQHARV
ncbi:Importin alpha subunit (Karyopherin alpha subunit) (Serine-rich RNA polymerase I suppressor protein) [Tulasnella sp. 408]|nr:Importin alpha subunit (Karyopherin alpha subunit) (Serine-rich RNA polymerase I suppressor protein) [Tulasnella sp. 408]